MGAPTIVKYRPCPGPTGGCTPWGRAATAILAQLDPRGRSLGCYNPRKARRSTRTWSLHACGRAVDWHPSSTARGTELAEWIVGAGSRDVQRVIWQRRQWYADGRGWRPYGADDHLDHIHVESANDRPA